jgi:NAD-dependent DNA ligase
MQAGYNDLKGFFQSTAEDFEKINGVGPSKAASLRIGLQKNKDLIDQLLKNGVKIKGRVVGPLSNISIAFTGAMENKRPVLEKMATDAGATVKSSVTKGLNILVISDPNSQSTKAVSARKLGCKLISEQDFLNIIK